MTRVMQGLLAVFGAVALLAAAVACTAPERVVVTAEDDGTTVEVRAGGEVVVELEGNPTTGFTWLEADVPDVLESRGAPEFVADSDAIGSGGLMTLTYDAVTEGEGTLELKYARTWESVPPEDTFSVTVSVEP